MIAYVIRLAILDFWHDRRISIGHALGMAATLAPLLILFGLTQPTRRLSLSIYS